ncbi:uncharacterized protein TRUGW13939_07108 [Talaromyces rugulosus]|uniref:F-box domain-containing protein n=1 Tax=Talaromyces rugulosus TaxID=121627 RepID=A0A7H8R1M8_TALRU|nr:uncharacterized protein TRUGW13939_07108 [Talaromyces rugulosus]QKX59966.1 hypothetical protein TRUGW13939_07108 [Talaromyces rugulosus]
MEDSRLLGCPVEICCSVLEYLPRKDLCSICLVNSHLRNLAEQILYAKILISSRNWQSRTLTRLLRSLLRRPRLATYVRSLYLHGSAYFMPYDVGKLPQIRVSGPELEEPLAFVASTTVPYRKDWLKQLRNGAIDAFVAALLSQPMRLNFLRIEQAFFLDSYLIGMVFRSMFCEPQYCGLQLDFSRLESVFLGRSYFNLNENNTADVLPMFYLPSVKKLLIDVENPTTFSWPTVQPPSNSSISVLNLLYVRECFLGDLVSVTKGLNSLEWEWMYTPELEDDKVQTPIIDLKRINKALYHVRETLTDLTIWAQCLYGYPHDWPMWDDYPQLSTRGTLRVMTKLDKLTELTIPITFLLGFTPLLNRRMKDVLPPNIKDLTMTDDLCLFW